VPCPKTPGRKGVFSLGGTRPAISTNVIRKERGNPLWLVYNRVVSTGDATAMSEITLRVLDGADRGRVFEQLQPPVTIGREEGNLIQLNDERVSRFHVKIQQDVDKFVLTDLESTNGTKVNGEEIQVRILRYGDMVNVGQSVLLFGSPEQISKRLARLQGDMPSGADSNDSPASDEDSSRDQSSIPDLDLNWPNEDLRATLHAVEPPELPERLSPGQAAQLSELLEYIHLRLRGLLDSVQINENSDNLTLDMAQWQQVLDLQARVARYLRKIGEPE